MTELHLKDMQQGYLDALTYVIEDGRPRRSRNMPTLETRAVTFVIHDARRAMPELCTGRRVKPALGVSEALQLIAGRSYPRMLERIAPRFREFMDGEVLSGAYGPRVRSQLAGVVRKLQDDADTRQAVLQIWDPLHDLYDPGRRDVPCTVALQFFIDENNALELHTYMRSQDAWLGLAYDIEMFAELQGTVAHALDRPVGRIHHRVGSFHIYERDLEKAHDALNMGLGKGEPAVNLGNLGVGPTYAYSPPGTIEQRTRALQERADMLLRGVVPAVESLREMWMLNVLEPYRG